MRAARAAAAAGADDDFGRTRASSGSGSGSGSGFGSGRRSCSRSYAARRISSLVISSFDDWSLDCGGARRRGGGFSALSLFERAREGSPARGLTRSCRVSRTAVSFCCRRIALTMAACFSALTAMSARRRASLTSARSCEGAEGGGAGVAAQLCFRTTGGREGAVYRTFPLGRASSWLATISRCWIA